MSTKLCVQAAVKTVVYYPGQPVWDLVNSNFDFILGSTQPTDAILESHNGFMVKVSDLNPNNPLYLCTNYVLNSNEPVELIAGKMYMLPGMDVPEFD
jgi:hypothetical protein